MGSYHNARVYWEMYGGLPPEGWDQNVCAFDVWMKVGGYKATAHPDFDVSIYGRSSIDKPNLKTFYSATIDGTTTWKDVHVACVNTNSDVRCIVVKLEANTETPDIAMTPPTKGYADQYDAADVPPWGVRIMRYAVYGSVLKRDVRPHRILRYILQTGGFDYSGPSADFEPEQFVWDEVPKDRWEALDEVNAMLGWDYWCYDGNTVHFAKPNTGTIRDLASDDPRTSWSVAENTDEVYSGVRVKYANRRGKPREVLVHADKPPLPVARWDCIDAPESVRSEKGAIRCGTRYLASHGRIEMSGSVTVTGFEEGRDDVDPLLIRPGNRLRMTGPAVKIRGTEEITHVTLRPLDWTAEVQFGANSKRFDAWLARLAVGAHRIKRR